VERFPGFTVNDAIQKHRGRWRALAMPEDWGASRWWAQEGLRVFATRKVRLVHYGRFGFANDSPWGTQETDTGDPCP
jgi:hypothetical protein